MMQSLRLVPRLFFTSLCLLLLVVVSAGSTRYESQSANEQATSPPNSGKPQASSPASSTASRSGDVDSEFVIGPADQLLIDVWKEPDITRRVPVLPDGRISLPLIGDVVASGLTVTQLQDQLKKKLSAYISNPDVTVIVEQVNSRKFNILGEVQRPGTYELTKTMTVLDALALGGSFKEFAKTKSIYVLRPENGRTVRLPFNYKAVIKGKKLDQNVVLHPGDTIIVP